MAGQTRPGNMTGPTGVSNDQVGLDRSRRLAWWDVQHTEANEKLDAAADPTHSNWIHKFDLGNSFKLLYGRIVDAVDYVNCYKVQVEHGMPTLWCTAATMTALQPMGAKQFGQIPIGAGVIIALHPNSINGVILGVIPEPQTASNTPMADFVSQEGRSGLLVEEAHSYPITLDNSSFIIDYSSGRPLDATSGEFGFITDTGIMGHIDSFMIDNRVDEETGVWSFFHDQLTRVSGHNLQIRSTGYEREDLDDEGEIAIVEGYTPYYWEALGAFTLDTTVARELEAGDWQKNPENQGYSATEPCSDDQEAFYRYRKFYGYLGQAEKRVVCLPPDACSLDSGAQLLRGPQDEIGAQDECDAVDLNLLAAQDIYPGVFEENLALTGRWAVRSAHEIIFSKYIAIPTPKRVTLSEDINGDNFNNYKAAGALGFGDQHFVVGETIPTGDDPAQLHVSAFLDVFAYAFNWVGDHPFHYHSLDWFIPEESALQYLNDCSAPAFDPPEFDRLACEPIIPTPAAIPIKVDERYDEVSYYPNHSYFGMLSDGGIVIGDGFGAEIRLVGGSIRITAPGDVSLEAGRDVISLAGFDLILRAKNSWDITATNRDGRIKVERNLMMIAANECGGILLESKATRPTCKKDEIGEEAQIGGIVIRAEDTLVSINSKHLTLKTKDRDDNVLTLDAGEKGRVKLRGKYIESIMPEEGAAFDIWAGGCAPEGSTILERWKAGVFIPMPLVVNDNILSAKRGIFKDDIISTAGHVATFKANDYRGFVGHLTSSFTSPFDYFNERKTYQDTLGPGEIVALCDRQENYICDIKFTFRTVAQYKTEGYIIHESRWQQIARLGDVPVSTWTEKEIDGQYPYPGTANLEGATLIQVNLSLFDLSTGLALDRGSIYEDPIIPAPTAVMLNGGYMVII